MAGNIHIKEKTTDKRFALTLTKSEDWNIVTEFKEICKKQKKRYTRVILAFMQEYIDDYKATR